MIIVLFSNTYIVTRSKNHGNL